MRATTPITPPAQPQWLEAIIDVPTSAQEAISAELFDAGASAITELVEDLRFHIGGGAEAMTGDDPDRVNLKALFQDRDPEELRTLVETILTELAPHYPGSDSAPVLIETIEQEDWRDKWKEGFTVTEISPRLLLKPSWQEATPAKGQSILEIDPGMAFGTGTHETTRACLQLIDDLLLIPPPIPLRALPRPLRVLDVGTGTGILAIAAVKLGASAARGVDIDPLAVTAARENGVLNAVDHAFTADGAPVQRITGHFELVVANILLGPLIELAPAIAARVAPGGAILLSGLLVAQAPEVIEAYTALGFDLLRQLDLGDWSALVLAEAAPSGSAG